jgi:hypothetical protein
MMGFAIVFEDLIKSTYWWVRGGHQGGDKMTSGWWRIFGYIWVWMYLGWSLPKLVFPGIDCNFEYKLEREMI